MSTREEMIGLGGGCHWCTEAVFQALRGVRDVRQGFIRAAPPDEAWSEAVEVVFDPAVISMDDLIAVHLATHASTSDHSMRGKYRSAIYAKGAAQRAELDAALRRVAAEAEADVVTRVLAHEGFKPSQESFHNYYARDPRKPFCKTYIDPKLAKLRARFAALMKEERGVA